MKIRSKEDFFVDAFADIFVFIIAVVCVYPMVYCISMSLSGDDAVLKAAVKLFPVGLNLDSYRIVLDNKEFLTAFKNSVVYTVIYTAVSVIVNMMLGYVLSRRDFVFKRALTVYLLIPMMFGGGLIPTFLVIKGLGLYNSMWALILPGAVSIWNAILAKTFIQTTIPNDVIESAVIDGANDLQIFTRIVLPLSTTIIAILCLYAAVGMWNSYFSAMIYLTDNAKMPLQVYLKKTVISNSTQALSDMMQMEDYVHNLVTSMRVRYVLIVVSTLPIIVVYPFIQKYFVKGVMLGSVKG